MDLLFQNPSSRGLRFCTSLRSAQVRGQAALGFTYWESAATPKPKLVMIVVSLKLNSTWVESSPASPCYSARLSIIFATPEPELRSLCEVSPWTKYENGELDHFDVLKRLGQIGRRVSAYVGKQVGWASRTDLGTNGSAVSLDYGNH